MKTIKSMTAVARPLAAAMALAGLAAFTLSGCGEANSKAAEAPAAGGPPVSAAAVVEKTITETQEFSGRLEAIDQVQIRPRVSGFITAINFKPGSQVKKGDVLFVIDQRPFQAEASRAEAAANSARAKADLAKVELTRAEKLLADKAIAQREYDASASGYKQLDADARAAQAQYENAKLNLSYTQVTSPINGRVSKAEITLGNLVDQTAVLTSVVSLDQIYASFDGDEDTYLRVGAAAHQGKPAVVKIGLANETGFPHEGKLEFVDNQLDPRSGSVRMRAILANTDGILVPGLFARVQLAGSTGAKSTLLINDRAVNTDQNRKFVFVVGKDNKAEYRPVTLGQQVDGLRIVRDGLKPGEKIVVNGLQRVKPGAPITPNIVPMDADPLAAEMAAKKEQKIAAADKKTGTTKE
ncbi:MULTISPECIES: efflux RND transporter periplasmic adaptor subunit [unclassified Duganella]|uniref:efflux RND transporter periplasmic adaptor subunit n=1 Tax=unclassified Duganella TaxID=2636909 RepID=UPI00088CB0E9|nr:MULTISPECIES: efflux RND transporter periplasmic adaptor subunit [unclassified Duganella]SDF61065.1 membrane fusion protein, multidrug efflux system [Duganella sp. OV458]SDI67627.1 membrane fusion protein, multidrug efflux system [Duganella sp. OV510]